MKISRLSLLATLKSVEPALAASNNQLEVLSHFWFLGNVVAAFDGAFGIQVGLKADFTGGVLGSKLIGILEKSRARDVTLEKSKDDNLLLTAGTARITFALKSIEDWIWDPAIPDKDGFSVTEDFISAAKSVLFSVGVGKVLSPEQRGITAIQNGVSVDLYSTDAVTLSKRQVKTGKTKPLTSSKRVILPTLFCEQFCKTAGAKDFTLVIDDQSVYCTGQISIGEGKAEILIFSQLVDDDNPVPFEEVMEKYTQSEGEFSEPGRLKMALERAMVLLSSGETAEFGIDKDKKDCYLTIKARSPYGEVDDEFKVEGDHPPIKVKIDAALLRRGLGGDKKESQQQTISITQDCVLITGPDNFWHVVATK